MRAITTLTLTLTLCVVRPLAQVCMERPTELTVAIFTSLSRTDPFLMTELLCLPHLYAADLTCLSRTGFTAPHRLLILPATCSFIWFTFSTSLRI